MTELDGAERLDPALRASRRREPTFRSASIQLMREPFNQRRREAAEHTDAPGVQIVDDNVPAESGRRAGAHLSRRSGESGRHRWSSTATPAGSRWETWTPITGSAWSSRVAAAARWCRSTTGWRPEHPYPAALDDAIAVLRWVAANATELGVDAARLAVAGSSAGATLAACLAHGAADGSLPRGRVPAAAPAGAGRSSYRVESGVSHQPGFRQRGRGSDVALLPGPRRRDQRPPCPHGETD